MSDEYIKPAYSVASFHGETWCRCPHCDMAFEVYDAEFERCGIKKTDKYRVYLCKCGNKFSLY